MKPIENFRLLNKGCVKASFQAIIESEFGPWCVNMIYFEKDNGESWMGYPSKEYTNKEGDRKYFRQSYPGTKEGKESFEIQTKEAVDILIKGLPENPDSQQEFQFIGGSHNE